MTLIDFAFPQLRPPKTWLEKCLKSPVSEDPSRSNTVTVGSAVVMSIIAPFAY